jgi:hypothetical protein
VLASFFLGWEIVMPLYFANYIRLSQGATFYYPSPRAIQPCVARALPIALIATYAIPTIQATQSFREMRTGSFNVTSLVASWETAHLCFPLTLLLCSKVVKMSSVSSGPEAFYSSIDMPYRSWFHSLVFTITSTMHLSLISTLLAQLQFYTDNFYEFFVSLDMIRTLVLSLIIAAWCVFTVWDLQRVNVTDVTLRKAVVAVITGCLVFGPAGTMTLTWDWRETQIQRARARQGRTQTSMK